MDFALSTEQNDFRRALRGMVEARSPLAAVRAAVETDAGYDRELWARMGTELGLAGLLVPEEHGGSGASLVDVSVVVEELGRGLVPSPCFATVALGVVPLLALTPDDTVRKLLSEVAGGQTTLTLAGADPGATAITVHVDESSGDATLTGAAQRVIDGHTADKVLVLAPTGSDAFGVYLVDGDAPGLQRSRVETLDLTRPMATLRFENVKATLLGEPLSREQLSSVLDRVHTLFAAEMVGGLDGAMTMAVGYATVRHQFDRPIGSFQAIKHRCAEMAVELDAARAAVLAAAFHASVGDEVALARAAPTAVATAAAGFVFAASWNIQIHGGIGFTWECDAHLFYRRAKSDEVLFGSPKTHWLALADRLGI